MCIGKMFCVKTPITAKVPDLTILGDPTHFGHGSVCVVPPKAAKVSMFCNAMGRIVGRMRNVIQPKGNKLHAAFRHS
jgi:hypothetical protein